MVSHPRFRLLLEKWREDRRLKTLSEAAAVLEVNDRAFRSWLFAGQMPSQAVLDRILDKINGCETVSCSPKNEDRIGQ